MGWSGFDFGKVLKHLTAIGVETLSWDGKTVTVTPASAQEKVHIDVLHSLQRGAPVPLKLVLRQPGDRIEKLESWAKAASRRLSRSPNQTNDGSDHRHAEAVLPLLTQRAPIIELLRKERREVVRSAIDGIEFPWSAPGPGMFSSDAPAEQVQVSFANHTIEFTPTDQDGIHSGRTRVKVECLTCGEVIHRATTGARSLSKNHWQDVLEGRVR